MRRLGRLFDTTVYITGIMVSVAVLVMFYYIARESTYAFRQTFSWGYRLALLPGDADSSATPNSAPYSSLVAVNPEGADGLDEKEEVFPAPTIQQMQDESALVATATPLASDLSQIRADTLYRDDWRSPKPAEEGTRVLVLGYAAPGYSLPTMYLAWEPDHSFEPRLASYRLVLRLLRAPEGVSIQPFEIDLRKQPTGRIALPTWVAQTDAERTQGYVFEVAAIPQTSTFWATLRGVLGTEWAPTLIYPRYGILPLVLATTLMSILAMLIATPLGVATALYLSEVAHPRVREWLKPALELIASVPSVVLGYFGLMFVAPALQAWLGQALGMQSGRNLLTTSIILAVLAIPIVASVTEDVLKAVPESLRESAIALGLNHSETLWKVVLPAARAGVVAAVLIGAARVYGETMIVWILSGGTATMPAFHSPVAFAQSLVSSTRGVPDTIAIEMGNVTFESVHYGHLFLLGLVLFCLTVVVNLAALRIGRRQVWRV
ncbi:MAG: phosphate ABC transporter permease subunit PstC [Armatimonadota bacterium]|nr:phosphate ABC transporter permease subunit PstC [bacterium]MCS7310513.1 phosphate ABC transporter permease subunit PstC [Armatimonadota bacterium]MDW8105361.1 phosphate ABC transporter permease subunit PstC [Armatimonadota bacterium]MDW8289899.1 phosphate ABC transporter permease subunit PstC [Armatimonadota bacterium]